MLKPHIISRSLLSGTCLLLLSACASTSTEPRVREGRLPDQDAFGSVGEPRQAERRPLPDGAVGSLVQVSRDNTFATVSVPQTLRNETDFLVSENSLGQQTGVLGTSARYDSERLISVFVLEGNPRIGDIVRLPSSRESATFTETLGESLEVFRLD